MSKHENLNNFINNLVQNEVKVKVIAIQETWNIPYDDLIKINGFNFVAKTRNVSKGGGVAFYVRNNTPYKILNNLSSMQEKVFECLSIEIILNKKKLILSNIYHSPNPPANITQSVHAENFISNLDAHLHNLSLCNTDTYVFLDSNINLLNIVHNVNSQLYLETIFSNGFLQCIGKATRIVKNCYSLIDHILTNSNRQSFESHILCSKISDHFPILHFLDFFKPLKSTKKFESRNFSDNNVCPEVCHRVLWETYKRRSLLF
jgi:hypothetical protein